MWRPSFLIIYFILNFYICFRLIKLLAADRSKKIFTLFYFLLASIFPLIELFSHNSGMAGAKFFLLIGYYSLPYVLYLFPVVLLFDILLGVNRLLKVLSIAIIHSRNFRIISLWGLSIIPLLVVIMGSFHYNDIQIKEYHIQIPRKSSLINHLRIAMAADFHLRKLTKKQFVADFVTKINLLNPDIVLIPGDVIEDDRQDKKTIEFERQFRQIRAPYGVYASFGNHEFYGEHNKLKFFQNADIKVLQNTVVMIDRAFYWPGEMTTASKTGKQLMNY